MVILTPPSPVLSWPLSGSLESSCGLDRAGLSMVGLVPGGPLAVRTGWLIVEVEFGEP